MNMDELGKHTFTAAAPRAPAQAGRNKQTISMEMEKAFSTRLKTCGCGGNHQELSFFQHLAICNHGFATAVAPVVHFCNSM